MDHDGGCSAALSATPVRAPERTAWDALAFRVARGRTRPDPPRCRASLNGSRVWPCAPPARGPPRRARAGGATASLTRPAGRAGWRAPPTVSPSGRLQDRRCVHDIRSLAGPRSFRPARAQPPNGASCAGPLPLRVRVLACGRNLRATQRDRGRPCPSNKKDAAPLRGRVVSLRPSVPADGAVAAAWQPDGPFNRPQPKGFIPLVGPDPIPSLLLLNRNVHDAAGVMDRRGRLGRTDRRQSCRLGADESPHLRQGHARDARA